jgi:hypothetical protein
VDDRGGEDTDAVIELVIPAEPAFARLARLTAARLARRHGFTYREVEDLRLAVDEAMVALLAPDRPGFDLEIRYTVSRSCIEIDFTGVAAATDEQADRFDTIVADLVDERSLDRTGHNIRLVKRHETARDDTDDDADREAEPAVPGSDLKGI